MREEAWVGINKTSMVNLGTNRRGRKDPRNPQNPEKTDNLRPSIVSGGGEKAGKTKFTSPMVQDPGTMTLNEIPHPFGTSKACR